MTRLIVGAVISGVLASGLTVPAAAQTTTIAATRAEVDRFFDNPGGISKWPCRIVNGLNSEDYAFALDAIAWYGTGVIEGGGHHPRSAAWE